MKSAASPADGRPPERKDWLGVFLAVEAGSERHEARGRRLRVVRQSRARSSPLALRIGVAVHVLTASDVNLLIEGAAKMAEGMRNAYARTAPPEDEELRAHHAQLLAKQLDDLADLEEDLASVATSRTDPPLELPHARAQLCRGVIADLNGYQRRDLTPGLRELRQLLGA